MSRPRPSLARPRPSLARRAVRALGRAFNVAFRAIRGALTKPTGITPLGPMLLGRGRIGGDLNPEDVSRILLMADQGYLHGIIDLFDESRQKDCHLHAVCANFELSLAAVELQVIPASSKRQDRKIAAWVEEWLINFGADASENAVDLYGLIEHLARGYWYDHAVAEILYERRNGQIIPFTADLIGARRFCRGPIDGVLRFWDDCGTIPYPGIDLRRAYPNRYIQFEPRVTGGGPNREGLMVLLVWAALFRNWTIRDWLMLGELAWKPWRIGYYKKEALNASANAAGKRDIDALEAALQHLVSTGATMLPDTVKLDVQFPTKTGSGSDTPHQSLATFMADEMSKAALGSTLTVQQGKTGAMALGQVHAGVTRNRRDAGLRSVSGCLRRDLVTPAVRLNYGASASIPKIQLVPDDEIDMTTLATAVKDLADTGLPISVQWVLKKLGAPMPKPGDLVLGNPTPAVIPMNDAPRKPRRKMPVRLAHDRLAA